MTKLKRFVNGGYNHWPITDAIFHRRWRDATRTACWAMNSSPEHRAFFLCRRAGIAAMRGGVDFGTRAKQARWMDHFLDQRA